MPPNLSRIRYIVLSDLHLGDRDSVLTHLDAQGELDALNPSRALRALVDCLRALAVGHGSEEGVTLILNGDIVELAFGAVSGALNTFERLAELLHHGESSFRSEVLLIPGNHDHHLWEMARETLYRMEVVSAAPRVGGLPPPSHVTPLSPEHAVPSLLLETVLTKLRDQRDPDAEELSVGLLYPNLALVNETLDRALIVHHGHFVESLYHFFSRVRRVLFPNRPPPRTVQEIEAENFAWIDFVWSLLGRSGGAGEDVQRVFDLLLHPELTREFAADLARRAARLVKMPFLPFAWLRELVLRRVFLGIANRASTERTKSRVVCSSATLGGLDAYLFGPTYRQVKSEFGRVPSELSFVFGHTHKPFERATIGGEPVRQVDVFNTGGWVIDSLAPDPAFGASVLLVSETLEVAAIRLFNDGEDSTDYQSGVRGPHDRAASSFADHVGAWLDDVATTTPWTELSAAPPRRGPGTTPISSPAAGGSWLTQLRKTRTSS